jgi:hypothetical protein
VALHSIFDFLLSAAFLLCKNFVQKKTKNTHTMVRPTRFSQRIQSSPSILSQLPFPHSTTMATNQVREVTLPRIKPSQPHQSQRIHSKMKAPPTASQPANKKPKGSPT